MSNYNNHEEEDQVPILLPIKRKIDGAQATPSDKNNKNNDSLNTIIKDSIQKTPVSVAGKEIDKSFGQMKKATSKQDDTEKKGKEKKIALKKDTQFSRLQNQKSKQNQKMKSLIAQMLSSMTSKNNATQQLYPVSNEIIQDLMARIDEQIIDLKGQAERKSTNQNNLHAQKQLQVIRRQINHCILIKQLYYEKMNYRNKIQALQQDIINLRSENRDLKLKVSRGIESIENYKHNLPCDREKELIEKLSICTQDLTQEREMRQNLQKNIESIIMNFKKLYDEADAARKIVTQKLKEVQQRQKKLKKLKQNDKQKPEGPKKMASFQLNEQKKHNESKSFISDSFDNQLSSRKDFDDSIGFSRANRPKPLLIMTQFAQEKERQKEKTKQKIAEKQRQKQKQRQRKQRKLNEAQNEAMTLEDKIKKMRNNQVNFKKNFVS